MRNLFNKKAKQPNFVGDLMPLNDPVFGLMKRSDIGRGLLALNGDAHQRVYRTKTNNIASAFPDGVKWDLWNAAGLYDFNNDSILLLKHRKKMHSLFKDVFYLAHELAHRFQHKNKTGYRHESGYSHVTKTLLAEFHANNIAHAVVMQVAKSLEDNFDSPEFSVSATAYFMDHSLKDLFDDYLVSDDSTLESLMHEIFIRTFDHQSENHDSYINRDIEYLSLKEDTSIIGSWTMYASSIIMAPSSAAFLSGDNTPLGLLLGVAAAGFGLIGYKFTQAAKSISFNNNEYDSKKVFQSVSLNCIPNSDGESIECFAVNDNDMNEYSKVLNARIADVKEKGPVIAVMPLTGEELRGPPLD